MGNLNIWLQFIATLVDSLKLPITASVIAIIILRFRRCKRRSDNVSVPEVCYEP